MLFELHTATLPDGQRAIRTLRLTIALSLLIHLAGLTLLPRVRLLRPGDEAQLPAMGRLEVQLAEPSRAAPLAKLEPSRPAAAPAPRRANPVTSVAPPLPRPALAAPVSPAPAAEEPPAAIPPAASPVRSSPPPYGDLWSYIQARRRERGEPSTNPSGTESANPHPSLAANLPAPATGVATQNRPRGGGMFEIRRMNYDDAAFEFFGWNNEMGRKAPQLVEVRIGDNSDMRTAVVRRMIAIIREHSQGDFIWRSPHRENGVTLSARPADNVELESFLLHDLFDDGRQPP